MNYIQSNAVRKYWEETGYKPTLDEKVFCVLENNELTLKDKLSIIKELKGRRHDERIEKYLSINKYYIDMFECKEEDEPYFYYCEEEHFNNCEDAFAFVTQSLKKDGKEKEDYYFDIKKVYLSKGCCGITSTYRYRDGNFDIFYVFPDLEIMENQEDNEYRFLEEFLKPSYKHLPFKVGDLVINYRSDVEVVLSEVDGGKNACFYVGKDGLMHESYYINPYCCDYPTESELEDFDVLLKLSSSLIKGEMKPCEFISKFEGTKKIMQAFKNI